MKAENITKCKYCGKKINNTYINRKFCNRKCYGNYIREHPEKIKKFSSSKNYGAKTLCWKCKHTNQNECSWFTEDMVPVPGWKAIERPTSEGMSYIVLECPRYEREEKRKKGEIVNELNRIIKRNT